MDEETAITKDQWRAACGRWEIYVKQRDAEIVALKRQIRWKGRVVTCKWCKDGYHMAEHDYYQTECDNLFQFSNDGPKENHFVYCPYCGLKIEEVKK